MCVSAVSGSLRRHRVETHIPGLLLKRRDVFKGLRQVALCVK